MTKLYVYSNETGEHVATISGESDACYKKFEDVYGSNDYACTFSPAFGFAGGLVENGDAEEIDAE